MFNKLFINDLSNLVKYLILLIAAKFLGICMLIIGYFRSSPEQFFSVRHLFTTIS